MDREFYKGRLTAIEKEAAQKRANLMNDFALANNPIQIGDTIADSGDTLVVKSIGVYKGLDFPECYYKGIQLKKDGTPKKIQDPSRRVFQSAIKTINGEPYKYNVS